ncbi:MAG: thiamine phosphate synthase [Bacillota bacterium]
MFVETRKKGTEGWNLYLVTEQGFSAGRSSLEVAREAIAGGVEVIQLRDKQLPLPERYWLGRELRQLTREKGVELIVNDRADLAQALEADGVHLGQSDLPPAVARKLLGEDKIIGVSVSTPDEARVAEEKGADYLGVGAIYSTQSKEVEKSRSSLGIEKLREIRDCCHLPLVAIGGLTRENSARVISALTQAEDVRQEAKLFREQIIEAKSRKGEKDE